MITVAVVDNHETVQRGVASLLDDVPAEFRYVGGHPDPGPLLRGEAPVPDVVVLDLWLGRDDVDSVDAIAPLRAAGAAVLLHTSEERPVKLRAAVRAGALGLALKSDGADAFLAALRGVAASEFACSSELAAALLHDPDRAATLAAREIQVLESLADGLTREQVARRLGLSDATIKTYLARVREKYLLLGRDVTNAASMVRESQRDGHTPLPRT